MYHVNVLTCTYILIIFLFTPEFHPVFEIVDSITDERRIYDGVYTLKALQGGTKATNMRSFLDITNV